jgi:hypothetical protein
LSARDRAHQENNMQRTESIQKWDGIDWTLRVFDPHLVDVEVCVKEGSDAFTLVQEAPGTFKVRAIADSMSPCWNDCVLTARGDQPPTRPAQKLPSFATASRDDFFRVSSAVRAMAEPSTQCLQGEVSNDHGTRAVKLFQLTGVVEGDDDAILLVLDVHPTDDESPDGSGSGNGSTR